MPGSLVCCPFWVSGRMRGATFAMTWSPLNDCVKWRAYVHVFSCFIPLRSFHTHLLHVPALLACQAQLKGDVVAKVELLLAGQVVGAVKVLDGVVKAIFLQQGFSYERDSV